MSRASQLTKSITEELLDQDTAHNALKQHLTAKLDPRYEKSSAYKSAKLYAGYSYKHMNHVLRHGILNPKIDDDFNIKTLSAAKKHITNLRSLTIKPTQNEFHVYRGVHNTEGIPEKEGDTFSDKGFISTSLSRHTASNFSSINPSESKIFKIHVTPGIKGHYISGYDRLGGETGGEREFILHPNTKFRIGKTHEAEDGSKYTELHIHSQED